MSTASGALVMVNCQEVSSRSEPQPNHPYPILEEGILLILCPTIAMARKRTSVSDLTAQRCDEPPSSFSRDTCLPVSATAAVCSTASIPSSPGRPMANASPIALLLHEILYQTDY